MRPKNSPRYVRINIIKVVDFYTENDKFSNILPKFLKFQKCYIIGSIFYVHSSEDNIFTAVKRLLSVPLTAKRSNQSILKEIKP